MRLWILLLYAFFSVFTIIKESVLYKTNTWYLVFQLNDTKLDRLSRDILNNMICPLNLFWISMVWLTSTKLNYLLSHSLLYFRFSISKLLILLIIISWVCEGTLKIINIFSCYIKIIYLVGLFSYYIRVFFFFLEV